MVVMQSEAFHLSTAQCSPSSKTPQASYPFILSSTNYAIQAIVLFQPCRPEDTLNLDHTCGDWELTCQVFDIAQVLGLHLGTTAWSMAQGS